MAAMLSHLLDDKFKSLRVSGEKKISFKSRRTAVGSILKSCEEIYDRMKTKQMH